MRRPISGMKPDHILHERLMWMSAPSHLPSLMSFSRDSVARSRFWQLGTSEQARIHPRTSSYTPANAGQYTQPVTLTPCMMSGPAVAFKYGHTAMPS